MLTIFSKEQRRAEIFIYSTFALILVFTMTMIAFQGFSFYDFKLPDDFLNWLGGAAIGEVAILAGIFYRYLFHVSKRTVGDNVFIRNSNC